MHTLRLATSLVNPNPRGRVRVRVRVRVGLGVDPNPNPYLRMRGGSMAPRLAALRCGALLAGHLAGATGSR